MGVLSSIRRIFRFCWRVFLVTLLVSLPVTLFPIIAGIEGACTFHFWSKANIENNVNALKFEQESGMLGRYYNVPGAMSFDEFQDQQGPFHIHRLGTGNWLSKMHFKQPMEHSQPSASVNQLGSFDGLVRDVGFLRKHADKPKRYWVYVTEGARFFRSEWDEAFDEILQQSYVKPLPSDSVLAYLDCARSGFLCGVWSIKAPSLLSFIVGNETVHDQRKGREVAAAELGEGESGWLDAMLDIDYTYNSFEGYLYPVTVKVIELPLEDAEPLLPRDTLPTPAVQLRALLSDPDPEALLEHWEPYFTVTQVMRRWNGHSNSLSEKVGSWRYYLTECDKWYSREILQPIFGREFTGNEGFMAEVQNIVFTIGIVVAELLHFPFTIAWNIYTWFFGLAWDGSPFSNEGTSASGKEGNFMEDLFAGALAGFAQNVSDRMKEQAARAAVTPS